jgi:Ni/Co efflux regulator RcnB
MSLKSIVYVLALISALAAPSAFADYDQLAQQQAQQQAANQRAQDFARVTRWSNDMNAQIMGAMNSFARQHQGLAAQPTVETGEYGDYGTDIKVYNNISRINFSTRDNYECKVDWDNVYDAEVHLELNCINSVTGRNINIYPRSK